MIRRTHVDNAERHCQNVEDVFSGTDYMIRSIADLTLTQTSVLRYGRTPVVLAAMAVESDIRIQVQRGAFTVHGSPTPLEQLPGNQQWLRKLDIPKEAVAQIARELRILGVGLADLFSDLHNLAKELRALHRRPR